jgi:hypothetical protein
MAGFVEGVDLGQSTLFPALLSTRADPAMQRCRPLKGRIRYPKSSLNVLSHRHRDRVTLGAGVGVALCSGLERMGGIPLRRSRQPQRHHQLCLWGRQQHAHQHRQRARQNRARRHQLQAVLIGPSLVTLTTKATWTRKAPTRRGIGASTGATSLQGGSFLPRS